MLPLAPKGLGEVPWLSPPLSIHPVSSKSSWWTLIFLYSGWGVGRVGTLGTMQCLLWRWPPESPEELCGSPTQEWWCPLSWAFP